MAIVGTALPQSPVDIDVVCERDCGAVAWFAEGDYVRAIDGIDDRKPFAPVFICGDCGANQPPRKRAPTATPKPASKAAVNAPRKPRRARRRRRKRDTGSRIPLFPK